MTIFLYNVINKREILDSHCSVAEIESLLEYYATYVGHTESNGQQFFIG